MSKDKSKLVILLGAGGHAKVLLEALKLSEREVIGIVTPDYSAGEVCMGLPVLGDDNAVGDYTPDEIELVNGLGSLPGKSKRWKLAEMMRAKGYQFTSVIHPQSVVANGVKMEEGVQIMAGVVIQSGVTIGRDSIINTGALIDHDCVISEQCHIAPGVVCSGEVRIGRGSHIGTGARIIQEISIGAHGVVAAGTTLYMDIEPSTLVKQKLLTVTEEIGKCL